MAPSSSRWEDGAILAPFGPLYVYPGDDMGTIWGFLGHIMEHVGPFWGFGGHIMPHVGPF